MSPIRWLAPVALAGVGLAALFLVSRGRDRPGAARPDEEPASAEAPQTVAPPSRRAAPAPEPATAAAALGRAAFVGRVVDAFGGPVFGALVALHREDDPAVGATPTAEVRTGTDGRFEIAASPASTCCLIVTHPEFAPCPPLRHLAAEAERTVDVGVVRLTAGLALRGRVLDPGDLPIADATVELEEELAEVGPFAPFKRVRTTDATGSFSFFGLARGRYRLSVRPPVPWAAVSVRDVEPRPRQEAPLDVHVAAGIAVTGRVREADGSSAAGARVSLEPLDGDTVVEQTTCDEQGRFSWAALRAGRYLLRAMAASTLPRTAELPVRLPETGVLELSLPAGVDLRLIFKGTEDGTAGLPHSAHVELVSAAEEGDGAPVAPPIELPLVGHGATLRGVPAGVWRLRARLRGFAPAMSPVLTVEDKPMAIELRLVAAGSVHGVLSDARGQAMVGFDVLAVSEDASEAALRLSLPTAVLARATTDATGRFGLNELPPGRLRLHTPAVSLAAGPTVTVEPGGSYEIDLAAAPTGQLRVELAEQLDGQHPELQIWAVGGNFQARRVVPASRVLHFDNLPAGRYGLRLLPVSSKVVYVEVPAGARVEARVP